LATVLLLGSDQLLQVVLPPYRIDALVRRQDLDRMMTSWNIRGNLIEAYDQLMYFVAKHLPDPFYLKGQVRVSLQEKIFREIVANLLGHREYLNGRQARFMIYADWVEVNNANHAVIHSRPVRPARVCVLSQEPDSGLVFYPTRTSRRARLWCAQCDALFIGLPARGKAEFVVHFAPPPTPPHTRVADVESMLISG
jgi:hypothetical protein